MTTIMQSTFLFSTFALSMLVIPMQVQVLEEPVYKLKLEASDACIPALPYLAAISYTIPVPKLDVTNDEFEKLSKEMQQKVYSENRQYWIPAINFYEPNVPLTFKMTADDGTVLVSPIRPGHSAYSPLSSKSISGFVVKETIFTRNKSTLIQFTEINNFKSIDRSPTLVQCIWYQYPVGLQGIESNTNKLRILKMDEEDRTLLHDFQNQPEYKSPTRCWLKCELNYPLLREKLSKQAKEQLVIYGFLRAIINAEKLDFAPVDWLDDTPEHLLPLVLTFRLEVALAKGEKQLEKRIDKEYPGLYWEIKRIKEGKGMLITILKERLGK